jgi:hypothetical protein
MALEIFGEIIKIILKKHYFNNSAINLSKLRTGPNISPVKPNESIRELLELKKFRKIVYENNKSNESKIGIVTLLRNN